VKLRPPWTAEENERLKRLVADGASAVRASGALNRTIISVRNQARKLGTPFPSVRNARKKITDAQGNHR
jgi:hypothetical protein